MRPGRQQRNFPVHERLQQLHFGFAGLPVAAGLVRQQRFGLGPPHVAPVALLVGEGKSRGQKEVFFQLWTARKRVGRPDKSNRVPLYIVFSQRGSPVGVRAEWAAFSPAVRWSVHRLLLHFRAGGRR